MTLSVSRRTAIAQISVGAALAGCTGTASRGLNPNTPKIEDVLSVQPEGSFNLYIANNRPIVMLTSGNSLPVPVMFDTGSSGNMIDRSVFEKFGLAKKPDHKSFITDAAGTTIETFAAILPNGRLSSLPFLPQAIDVADYRANDEAGILGPELFHENSIYLNFPKQSVYVRTAFGPGSEIPDATGYRSESGALPTIDIEIAGQKKMPGVLDTGKNGALSFPEEMIDDLPLVARPKEVGVAQTMFETVPVYGAQIDAKITIGTVTLARPDVIFHGSEPKVGMPVLGKQRIWIEPHRKRSWVASAQKLNQSKAKTFSGQFGIRKIWAEDDGLHYQKDGSPERRLQYLGGDQFLFEHSDTDLIFRRDATGIIAGFTLLGADGAPFEVTR